MAEQFANNASSTLNGSINNSVTSVVVTSGSVFPASGNYRIICGTEIMLVNARSTNTLTVARGQEGTTAASHTSGDSVSLIYTKGSIEQFLADMNQMGGWSSRPASPRQGTVYTATDLQARWWYDGTNWNLVHPTYVPYASRFIPGGWTTQNQSTATFTDKNGILDVTSIPSNNNAIRGYSKSLPSTPYKCTWILPHHPFAKPSYSWYVGHRENSSGKLKVMYNSSNSPLGLSGIEQWNTYSSFNSAVFSGVKIPRNRPTWVRVENDGTNFKYYQSFDGKSFQLMFSEAKTGWFTTAADQIFFGVFASSEYSTGNTANMTLLGYWEE